jgi:hypothetical protein
MKPGRTLLAAFATLALFAGSWAPAHADSSPIVPSGKILSESRTATGFTGLALAVPGKVELRQGSPESLTVEADDNLLREIETAVEGGKLVIRFSRKLQIAGNATIRVAVTAPRIESISVSGSGDVTAGTLAVPTLKIAISGSGDVNLANVQVDTLQASIAGSGDLRAGGRATELVAKIAGSGDLHAGKLESRRATVSIAGSGDALLWASESLTATIAGSGDVRYHGDPTVKKSVAGSGQVMRAKPAS